MRVIHIASFKGNAGDIINHNGFYSLFDDIFERRDITKVEIRDFYFSAKNRKRFDREFADTVNGYDLCVLGGGSFFDCQWPDSPTGTTMSIEDEFIDEVRVPVIVNAMGYHEFAGRTNDVSISRFERFIRVIQNRENWLITVRNDGSAKRLRSRYPGDSLSGIFFMADNAFYNDIKRRGNDHRNLIGISITNEALCPEFNGMNMDAERFNTSVAKVIERFALDGRKVMLFTHTPQDIDVLAKVIGNLSEQVRRNSIMIAPADYIDDERIVTSLYFEWYCKCDLIISMRFHGCVMGFLADVPTVALAGHEQLLGLYDELGMNEFALKVEEGFDLKLPYVIKSAQKSYSDSRNRYLERVDELKKSYRETVLSFIRKCEGQ